MREITTHKVNDCNRELTIRAVDKAAESGANHRYKIDGPLETYIDVSAPKFQCDMRFQNGPIAEVGVNGITHESVLAVIVDRLQGFQSGPYACRENALAITKLEEALHWLNHRTQQRIARGVEGTHQK